ncbi:hypothetical protein BABINDRAFT_168401 [Babjeviella inositovora NRRL Y-12698]|uniref:Tryptophan--tRNA ligase, mitochondrial n=1 Tax=Babjeviella inositovora NRRL Y-12698 TaxID=984486 RepID=A0A1E3QKN0_9ASCO|nr:uncharacterized protein BABINDRAFT_168401 [Babjeviella inositovora NRRL Y-12698]ODQ78210.1 hypothetical protein BABINDRAFT_168401 [Babjeviella inositovora NRRL Y-12698]
MFRRTYSTIKKTVEVVSHTNCALPPNSTVFSAIQPTGRFHLGNYLGSVRAWRELQDSAHTDTSLMFATADLHAITVPKDPHELRTFRAQAIASILASGIDPQKCTVFHQSSVAQHAELSWIFMCHTGLGYLNRMTQWKAKAGASSESALADVMSTAGTGLFAYPVLQVADILLYHATHVPVGDDQAQHLELTRHLAEKFNRAYGDTFPIPKTLLTPARKILSLRDPSKKMSKSDKDQTASIYFNEEPESIRMKVQRAVTDSIQGDLYYDQITRPGVSNMIDIISGITRQTTEETIASLQHIRNHKQLKDHMAEVVIEEFRGPKKLYEQLMADPAYLDEVCKQGTVKATEIAVKNMNDVKRKIGFL